MKNRSPLIIEQKIKDMTLYGYIALRQFPRAERHVLSAEIRRSMLTLMRLVAAASRKHHKKTTLADLDVELAALTGQVRLAFELSYINSQKYQRWSELNIEIGRLIGGWIRAELAS